MTNRKYLFQLSNTFLTCLSNHHKFICTILKSGRFKGARIEKIYRSYKTFDVDQFQEILKIKLENIKNVMVTLKLSFLKELNKYALLKRKFLRHNSNLFLTKNLRKQIMVRSKPRNNYNKNRNYENWWKYNANAIFVWICYQKQKRTSAKHLMKNKNLIAKTNLVTRTLIHQK